MVPEEKARFQDQGPSASEGFGEYLTRERTLRNIPLEEISQRTRISMRVLEALEAGRWEELPADVYVRGFLRTYARYLGLDENEVVVRYEDQRPDQARAAREPFPEMGKKKRASWRRRTLVMALLLAAGALAFYWCWWRLKPQEEETSLRPAPPGPTLRSLPMPPPPQEP